jgi:branched-subunit amino acid ABC-type transport system permease component
MPMDIALQLLFTGLGVGSMYAIVAFGFVLIYRATNPRFMLVRAMLGSSAC